MRPFKNLCCCSEYLSASRIIISNKYSFGFGTVTVYNYWARKYPSVEARRSTKVQNHERTEVTAVVLKLPHEVLAFMGKVATYVSLSTCADTAVSKPHNYSQAFGTLANHTTNKYIPEQQSTQRRLSDINVTWGESPTSRKSHPYVHTA